jgi:hypothetical protein
MIFDNRQLATLILLAAFLAWALSRRDVRTSVLDALKLLASPKLLLPFLLYGAWIFGLHWLAMRAHLWNSRLLGESIFWAGASGIALLTLAVTKAGQKDNFFRERAVDTIKFTAFFEFFLNLKTLSFIGELLLQPVVTVLVLIRAVAELDEQHRPIRKPLDVLLALVTFGLLFYTVLYLTQDWSQIDKSQELRRLLMPIWLTLGAFPFVFVFALIADYGQVFMRMRATNDWRRVSLRARLGVILALRTRLLDIHSFGGGHARKAGGAKTIRDGMQAVRAFRFERGRRMAEEQARLDRLEAFAGVKGTDEDGRQLDRREFEETKDALRWLATCHMGWYNQRKRYRKDFITIVNDFSLQGLPGDHGVVMRVRKDGQAWYAYRRTVTGWVLGIGANKGTPDQWFYDGPEPPTSYPRPVPGWGNAAHADTINWAVNDTRQM